MEHKDPAQAGHDTPPPSAGGPRKNARQAADDSAPLPESVVKAKGFYDKLFPPGSPRRKAGPWVIIAAVLIVLLVAKCAVSSAGDKITEVTQARAEEKRVRTTGVLLVKSNRPEATVEAVRLASADDPSTDRVNGALGQALPNLPPGKYAVTLRAEGWPDASGEVDVPAGQQTEATVNFKAGSLRLETLPTGATVKLGKAVLGKTPLQVPQLPPGENDLSLEYPSWPAVPHRVTITENQETAATVRLPHGRLVVDSFPAGATVVLQGKAYNKTPLFFDPIAVGAHKLTLQMKNFPPMEVSVTVTDGTEAKVRPILGTAFPLLDPAALLSAVWLPDDSNVARVTTGLYKPRNDVVKNLRRDWLYNGWLNKIYRISGPIKSYDAATGRVEFAEQKSDLARYRVVALVKPGTASPVPPRQDPKDKTPVVLALYGRLTDVDEPSWPGRVITLELTDAEFLPDGTP